METFFLIFSKLIPVYAVILVGFIEEKILKLSRDVISALYLYVLLPIVVLYAVANVPTFSDIILLPIVVFVSATVISYCFLFIGKYFYKNTTSSLLGFMAGTGNTGSIGVPLAIGLLGKNALGPAVVIHTSFLVYIYTVGFFMASKGKYSTKESIQKLIRLPTIYAFILGVLFQLLNIHIPKGAFGGIFDQFVDAYTIIVLMLVGISIATIKRESFDWLFISLSMVAKFIAWPAIILVILFLDTHLFHVFGQMTRQILFLVSFVPVAINTVSVATVLKLHEEKAAIAVFISTMFSLIYIPIMVALFIK